MEQTTTPTQDDVAAIVKETTAILTGQKDPAEIVDGMTEQALEDTNLEEAHVGTPAEEVAVTHETLNTEEKTEEEEPERKNVFGRPTKYSPEMLIEALAYLDLCTDKTVVEEVYQEGIHTEDGDAEETDEEEETGNRRYKRKPITRFEVKRYLNLPNIGGLAVHLKVRRSTLYEWEREHEDFSDIMEHLRAIQENRLINGGLSGSYNPTISKVILTKHGYREGIDQTTNDKDLPNVNSDKIQKKADAILSDD